MLLAALLAGTSAIRVQAQGLPQGAAVVSGSVSFRQTANALTVTQASQTAIVNYSDFSIGQGNTVVIHQPNSSSVILNRVTGSTVSSVSGTLSANGVVYLINPNGIAITPAGTVNVAGGFVASTLGISDADFLAGKRTFTATGIPGAVTNAGVIVVGRGGYAALIGGQLNNSGLISVPMGEVALGSGKQIALDVSGDGFMQVVAPVTGDLSGPLISNSGAIIARGGTVILEAATAVQAARNAVNISGFIDASSISGQDGRIVIGGGEGGAIAISGTLSVASEDARGGDITLSGQKISLTGASLDASGAAGGGQIRVGGDERGGGTLQQADSVKIDGATTIRADATANGDGGNVVVWSTGLTSFGGLISATGGKQGGSGGRAEVSSHGVLGYTGFTKLTAPKGSLGTLLLDPYDVLITNGTPANETFAGGTYTPSGTSVIDATTLSSQLGSANVIVTTGRAGSPGTDAGDITVAAPISWSSSSLLTLDAYHSVNIRAPITIAGPGGLSLQTNDGGSGGSYNFGLAGTSFAGSIAFTGPPRSGQNLSINGQDQQLLYAMSDIASMSTTGFYALAKPITTTDTYSGAIVNQFGGTLEGLGNTITGINISDSSTNAVNGLIGTLQIGGTIRDIGLKSRTILSSGKFVADLVAFNQGTIASSFVSGGLIITQAAGSNNGALTAYNAPTGLIVDSISSDSLEAGTNNQYLANVAIGGLAGVNYGTIINSSAINAQV
jgi:filamentous hemagglutinin family protein